MKTRRNEDRISNLPEPLIHYILSFLDMKYVVPTSVLSRRWRYILTTLPYLNFDDSLFMMDNDDEDTEDGEIRVCNDFVDRVLDLRERSDIQTFRLVTDAIEGYTVNGRIHKWINTAVKHNVQELYFSRCIFSHAFEIPHCLFNCNSLTKLEIMIMGDNHYEVLPSSMSLPRLKSLKLALPVDDERLTNMIFASCPALESLIIDGFASIAVKNLNISALKLKHFELFNVDGERKGKVKLYAPNLTFFKCEDFVSKHYSLENLSSLVTANIFMKVERKDKVPGKNPSELRPEKKELYAQRMMKFLKALHNVKVLTLSPMFLKVISRSRQVLENVPPQFSNLQSLKLRTWLSKDCMDAIIYLLKISPNLEFLSLQIEETRFYKPPMYPFRDEINIDSGSPRRVLSMHVVSPQTC